MMHQRSWKQADGSGPSRRPTGPAHNQPYATQSSGIRGEERELARQSWTAAATAADSHAQLENLMLLQNQEAILRTKKIAAANQLAAEIHYAAAQRLEQQMYAQRKRYTAAGAGNSGLLSAASPFPYAPAEETMSRGRSLSGMSVGMPDDVKRSSAAAAVDVNDGGAAAFFDRFKRQQEAKPRYPGAFSSATMAGRDCVGANAQWPEDHRRRYTSSGHPLYTGNGGLNRDIQLQLKSASYPPLHNMQPRQQHPQHHFYQHHPPQQPPQMRTTFFGKPDGSARGDDIGQAPAASPSSTRLESFTVKMEPESDSGGSCGGSPVHEPTAPAFLPTAATAAADKATGGGVSSRQLGGEDCVSSTSKNMSIDTEEDGASLTSSGHSSSGQHLPPQKPENPSIVPPSPVTATVTASSPEYGSPEKVNWDKSPLSIGGGHHSPYSPFLSEQNYDRCSSDDGGGPPSATGKVRYWPAKLGYEATEPTLQSEDEHGRCRSEEKTDVIMPYKQQRRDESIEGMVVPFNKDEAINMDYEDLFKKQVSGFQMKFNRSPYFSVSKNNK